jgi:hypothetical protein
VREASVKDQVRQAVEGLPADASIDDVIAGIDRLRLLLKVERARHELMTGEGIPREKARRTMKRWHG